MIASTLLLDLLFIKRGLGVATYAATAPADLRDEVSFALIETYDRNSYKKMRTNWLNSLS